MKKSFVYVPAFLIVLFLLNSFVLKEKEAGENTAAGIKLINDPGPGDRSSINPSAKDSVFRPNGNKPGLVNSVFKSTDGGQTWQDISEGLPEIEQSVNFFAGESDLYLQVKNEMYRLKSNLMIPVWEKENIPDPQSASIAFNRSGIMAFNYKGQIYQKTSATQTWLPIHTNFNKHSMRTIFETSDGTVFLGYDHGLYKSTDKGKNWKQVQNEGWVMNIVESEGVLIATGQKGIMRSTDNGEHWQWVISEGGVGIAIERIEGGFAAISCNTETESRRVRISLDSGKTWQAIDEGLRPTLFISSIKQVGKYLILGHPDGIFRTSDRGKTWKSVHSGADEQVDKKEFKFVPSWNRQVSEPGNVFKIFVSGNAMYAVAVSAGC
ncbi:exo-alpha-sialidase [Daejeonella sp.]|uniref:sialidase family protein n=1 Tax=Daejeonella sp. TaxID=2805397 RepID=UPI0027171189|nr:exo-alpha-sialidase [Daejeonella sp.]MDO8994513.1 exo-alpha-sialidase [Daejeonella sp.]MDP2414924.1 exo-alpha-sialidase [Daejeonella sp.]